MPRGSLEFFLRTDSRPLNQARGFNSRSQTILAIFTHRDRGDRERRRGRPDRLVGEVGAAHVPAAGYPAVTAAQRISCQLPLRPGMSRERQPSMRQLSAPGYDRIGLLLYGRALAL